MPLIEFLAQPSKTFSVQQYNPLTGAASGPPIIAPDVTELAPTLYRVVTPATGIVYVIATATNLQIVGYANLLRPGPNGASELLETYDEAHALGLTAPPTQASSLSPFDVRLGVSYLDENNIVQTGTIALPIESQVLSGVGYGDSGTELLGTLIVPTGQPQLPVNSDMQIVSPLWIGAAYEGQNGFLWTVPAISGVLPGNVVASFRGREQCDLTSTYAWNKLASSVTPVTIGGVDYWVILFELSAVETALILSGYYYWWVYVEGAIAAQYSAYRPLQWRRA